MIEPQSFFYDTEGNIILPENREKEACPGEETNPYISATHVAETETTKRQGTQAARWKNIQCNIYNALQQTLKEGGTQYHSLSHESISLLQKIARGIRTCPIHLWNFLCQPVWVPGPRKEPKQYSRIGLFFIDTIRFGGTFASIFVVLFTILNYQSFWQIIASSLDPLAQIQTKVQLEGALESPLIDTLKKVPSLPVAGRMRGDILSYLPSVGPPDRRLIIPKLAINVPVSIPPQDALLIENWTQLEEDIQAALEEGVVHYPGTARPGQAGNFFVTGHSSYYPWTSGKYKTISARLPQLNVGDEYWVYYNGDKHRYIIQEKKEVRPSDVSVLDQPLDRRIGTLMTCTPVGTTLKRLVLVAQEVDPDTGLAITVGDHKMHKELPKLNVGTLPI